jgi:hypothetical protein
MTTITIDARSEIERLSARVTQLEEIIANLATSMMVASMLNQDENLWPGAFKWADDAGNKLIPDEPGYV